MLVLLPRPAGARVVAPDLADLAYERRGLAKRRRRDFRFRFRARADERFLELRMLVLDAFGRARRGFELLDLLHLFRRPDGEVREDPAHLAFDRLQHLAEQLESLALVLLLGVLLRIAAEVNALAQMLERAQVLAPMLIEHLQ